MDNLKNTLFYSIYCFRSFNSIMNIEEQKPIIILISLILSVIIGVVFWFLLEKIHFLLSVEIASLISLVLISSVLTYFFHGKGLLPSPEKKVVKTSSFELKPTPYTRKKFNCHFDQKNSQNKIRYQRKQVTCFSHKSFRQRAYTRKTFRS